MSAVEWKCLDEIAIVSIGEFVHKDKQNPNAEYPVYNGGISNTGYYEDFNNTGNKIIISARGANAGYINRVFVNYWAGNSCYSISVTSNDVDWNFLFYYLKTNQQKLIGEQQKGGIPAISKKQICTFKIPIPSLAKQQEIVSHLDTFTSLISNLESELDMRRKQYEHYRNQLLDFEGVEVVEWKTLGEVGEFVRGNGIQKKDFVEDGYGCIHYGQVYTQFDLLAYETITGIEKTLYDKCRKAKCGDIVLATTSENLEDVAKPVIWLGEEEIAVSGDAFIYKHNQNPIFIGSQFLTERFSKFKGMNAKGAKVIRITGDSMAEYKIALPSLEKQNEIAEGIKSFENLIQSLEQEIKLRKQQYEYYREKLLTFE